MPTVAILGGGQLGRMLGLAGIPLGIACRFLDPTADAPAGAVGPVQVAPLDDEAAAARVAAGTDVVTFEWEGVPAATARALEQSHRVHPSSRALEVCQDRLAEKQLCRRLDLAVPEFAPVGDRAGLEAAVAALGLPCVLKARRGGYDGKGQRVLREPADLEPAWSALGDAPLVLEQHVPFQREVSVLAVRGGDGATAYWPVVENHHDRGILRHSRAPAPDSSPELQRRAEHVVTRLLDGLAYVGVLAVELFDAGGELLVNELAPRVHNSGHWTIEGAVTSQFENHLRAILGWPCGATDAVGVSAMLNCIGTLPDPAAVLAVPGTHLHAYGKAPRPGRKLGHVTVVARDDAELDRRLALIPALPGVGTDT